MLTDRGPWNNSGNCLERHPDEVKEEQVRVRMVGLGWIYTSFAISHAHCRQCSFAKCRTGQKFQLGTSGLWANRALSFPLFAQADYGPQALTRVPTLLRLLQKHIQFNTPSSSSSSTIIYISTVIGCVCVSSCDGKASKKTDTPMHPCTCRNVLQLLYAYRHTSRMHIVAMCQESVSCAGALWSKNSFKLATSPAENILRRVSLYTSVLCFWSDIAAISFRSSPILAGEIALPAKSLSQRINPSDVRPKA